MRQGWRGRVSVKSQATSIIFCRVNALLKVTHQLSLFQRVLKFHLGYSLRAFGSTVEMNSQSKCSMSSHQHNTINLLPWEYEDLSPPLRRKIATAMYRFALRDTANMSKNQVDALMPMIVDAPDSSGNLSLPDRTMLKSKKCFPTNFAALHPEKQKEMTRQLILICCKTSFSEKDMKLLEPVYQNGFPSSKRKITPREAEKVEKLIWTKFAMRVALLNRRTKQPQHVSAWLSDCGWTRRQLVSRTKLTQQKIAALDIELELYGERTVALKERKAKLDKISKKLRLHHQLCAHFQYNFQV